MRSFRISFSTDDSIVKVSPTLKLNLAQHELFRVALLYLTRIN